MTAPIPERLETWTPTLNEDDADRLLELAEPGMTLDEWREAGEIGLPQGARGRRSILLALVTRLLLDHDGERILDTAYLRLYRDAPAHRRRGLLYGRSLYERPQVHRALEDLVQPALRRAEEPLASPEADEIPSSAWSAWLRDTLRQDAGEASVRKTGQNLRYALSRVGVVRVSPSRKTTVTRTQPDPLAFGWLVAHELRDTGRAEMSEDEAATRSFAARLFAPNVTWARSCIDTAVTAGLLERSFLAGVPRLHAGVR